MRAIHLCCGAGGTTWGFEQAGIESVFAFDLDETSVAAHRANFLHVLVVRADFRALPAADLPPAEVWTCGLPCEPFSRSGLRLGADDPRDLSVPLARLIGKTTNLPRYIFLENLPPYAQTTSAALVRTALEARGYRWHEAVYNHADYGVPQRRRRWHLIAGREGVSPLPQPTHAERANLFGRQAWIRFGAIRDGTGATPLSARALRGTFRRVINNAAKYGNATPLR